MKNDNKRFYIYVYQDQRKKGEWVYKNNLFTYKPFYIGIGSNYRIKAHLTPFNLKRKSIKNNIIKSILKETGEIPLNFKLYTNITFEEAKTIEKDFIKFFGRIDLKTGILSNMTDGGDGNLGLIHSKEFLDTLYKKVYQYDLNGNFITEFNSLTEASLSVNCTQSNIRYAITKEKQAKGFQWRFTKFKKLNSILIRDRTQSRFKYFMYDKNTKKLLKIFSFYKEIELHLNKKISLGNITSCCNGKLKTAYGYIWKKNQ